MLSTEKILLSKIERPIISDSDKKIFNKIGNFINAMDKYISVDQRMELQEIYKPFLNSSTHPVTIKNELIDHLANIIYPHLPTKEEAYFAIGKISWWSYESTILGKVVISTWSALFHRLSSDHAMKYFPRGTTSATNYASWYVYKTGRDSWIFEALDEIYNPYALCGFFSECSRQIGTSDLKVTYSSAGPKHYIFEVVGED